METLVRKLEVKIFVVVILVEEASAFAIAVISVCVSEYNVKSPRTVSIPESLTSTCPLETVSIKEPIKRPGFVISKTGLAVKLISPSVEFNNAPSRLTNDPRLKSGIIGRLLLIVTIGFEVKVISPPSVVIVAFFTSMEDSIFDPNSIEFIN